MNDDSGWYIHLPKADTEKTKGPYDTATMEDYAQQGIILFETLISHQHYTKGRVVEAKRIARFFNILSSVTEQGESDSRAIAVAPPAPAELAGVPVGIARRRDDDVGGIGRFMADGQDPAMICKLAERVDGICTQDEYPLYMAVQQKPVVNFSPDAVVFTNRRAIIFRQKVLGRLQFVDLPWINVADVHLQEDLLGSTISIRGVNRHIEQVSSLPKTQARKIYRIAQDMEQKMVELRRERTMEEKRAAATNVVVNNDLGALVPKQPDAPQSDPVEALTKLKKLLDAELITPEEYEKKKSQILERM
ncbi:MAG: PH domain-containing protein [bacterium]|nr:PH domain-containing protein [bacterium]